MRLARVPIHMSATLRWTVGSQSGFHPHDTHTLGLFSPLGLAWWVDLLELNL